ncbi:MAG: DUF4942 domain-containing protein [Nitrosomonas sp.]|uniref:DUF4942 domain-containing protein n=1 Tax=Nitrosomonas sp. TaxID=42353 RepID=UPI0025D5E813|nr:DUF4942 domain-containing protein [Nitrosomonas sp.]MBY0473737.1 DUF4942 domain-containing protein [Nitrosomonas sp.]
MKTSTAHTLAEIQDTNQDFEWYPTTNEIIDEFHNHAKQFEIKSLLDIGAGNGKVLNRFKELNTTIPERDQPECFAIEKSRPLLDSMDMEIGILGTDFWEQSLLDKSVECIFTNPPYSEFIDWTVKVIREANANYIYLVLPQRWKEQKKIIDALEKRKAGHKVIGEFDFLNSEDRQARAKVDLIFVWLCHDDFLTNRYRYRRDIQNQTDPFEQWVCEFFALDGKQADKSSDYAKEFASTESRKKKLEQSIVAGGNMIETLDELYREEMGFLISNYQKVCSLDAALFEELNISVTSVIGSIKTRINGLKNAYWKELFTNYSPLTSRLTAQSRRNFSESINRKTNIDFTCSNAYAITVWAIKNADAYLDKQMIDTFDNLVSKACVINYKSNQRVFADNRWSYLHNKEENTHFKLDYRLVVTHGCSLGKNWGSRGGLSESGANFIEDILVVARNLGFHTDESIAHHDFVAGQKEEFYCINKSGKEVKLMEVRVYMNGNTHIKFNQAFMLAFNVEVGRLRGWIHNAQQAAAEMDEKVENVAEHFNTSYSLRDDSNVAGLLTSKAA